MKKIKIGIIGTGFTIGVAKGHISAYKACPEAEITAFYDVLPERAEKYKKDLNMEKVKICSSLAEFFNEVDALSICVPNNKHFETAKAAVDANRHFICEKPLSINYTEGKRLVDYVRGHSNKVIAMVGFNYRDIPAIRYMKHLVDDGKIGRIYSCIQQLGGSRIADPANVKREWRMDKEQSGAGSLLDFGSHMLDLADYLLAEKNGRIVQVQCLKNTFITERFSIEGGGSLPVTNDDCAVFTGITEKGTLCSFHSCRIGMPFQSLQITGEGGILLFNSAEPEKIGMQLKEKSGGYTGPLEYKEIPEEFFGREGHKGLIMDFLKAIQGDACADREIERGLFIQNLLDKIGEASVTGGKISV